MGAWAARRARERRPDGTGAACEADGRKTEKREERARCTVTQPVHGGTH